MHVLNIQCAKKWDREEEKKKQNDFDSFEKEHK